MYTVYKHTFPNGKVYIGLTNQPVEKRWQDGKGYRTQKPIWDAIKKFGWTNIIHEIIADNLSEDEARKMEHELIKKCNSTTKGNGYNSTTGGWESRLTYSRIWERPVLQFSLDNTFIQKFDSILVAAQAVRIAEWAIQEACVEAEHGDQGRKTIQERLVGTGYMWRFDYICQYAQDGEFIAKFASIGEAAIKTGIYGGISSCCDGRPKYKTAGGYVWRFSSHPFNKYPTNSALKKEKGN